MTIHMAFDGTRLVACIDCYSPLAPPAEYENVKPNFVVTQRGFSFYASKYVTPVEGNPDEPCFHGELWGDRVHPPKYEIHVKL